MKDQAAEATIAAVAQKFTVGGGVAASYGGITANDLLAYVGAVVAVLGLVVQWYYKRKDDHRKERLAQAQITSLQEDDE